MLIQKLVVLALRSLKLRFCSSSLVYLYLQSQRRDTAREKRTFLTTKNSQRFDVFKIWGDTEEKSKHRVSFHKVFKSEKPLIELDFIWEESRWTWCLEKTFVRADRVGQSRAAQSWTRWTDPGKGLAIWATAGRAPTSPSLNIELICSSTPTEPAYKTTTEVTKNFQFSQFARASKFT